MKMRLFVIAGVVLGWLGLVVLAGGGAGGVEAAAQCDLCADNWFFILGAGGRTGSTTALSMFNEVPGIHLTGEHFGVLRESWRIWERLRTIGEKYRVSAFMGSPTNDTDFMCSVQSMVKAIVFGNNRDEIEESTRILGFKEIRYASPNMMRFLANAFPCARFLLSVRNNVSVPLKASAFGDEAWMRKKWRYSRDLFQTMNKAFPKSTAVFSVEDLTVDRFNAFLHDMLGVQGCTFWRVDVRNSEGTFSKEFRMGKSGLKGVCDLSAVSFRYSNDELTRGQELWVQLAKDLHMIPRLGLKNPDALVMEEGRR
ncbi:hypothetical protein FVE85_7449 [Porphyridium purpureum]|uniref:Sulfotransferase n=1 Tax=Porphyridium purpureum TaxID=35688 RepID=A0A5J4ZA29_PORPP|nr:hypothetical protein FVE85_7449 [Porphyridium purpureum]|eukprot:POR7418..scf295_1